MILNALVEKLKRRGRGLLGGLWPSVVLVLIHTEHNCLQYECASSAR